MNTTQYSVHTWASPLLNRKSQKPESEIQKWLGGVVAKIQKPESGNYLPKNRKTGICGQYSSQKPEFVG